MLDPKYIREHAEEVKENCRWRNVKIDVDAWLKLDTDRLGLLREVEELRASRNVVAEKMKSAAPEERPALIEQGKTLKEQLVVKESSLEPIDGAWKAGLMAFPNLTHPNSPKTLTEDGSQEVRIVGEIKKLEKPLDHVALAEKFDLIDFNRGAKVAGAKFYFLKNQAAILEQALTRYAFDYLTKEGFIPISTPDVARDEVLLGTGYQPRGPETQIYSLEGTDLSLVGTAEIPLGGYHKDEVLENASLPLKYVGLSHCFRTEAGSYGKESYGLYRVHQFTKIEMFVFCTPEQSEALHAELIRHEENLFKSLNIPFRVLDICSGDLGGPAYRKYDLEAWMWGRNDGKGDWGEVTSASNCTDFQARRLNVRFKNEEGDMGYVHTLNGTAFAISRALIALLENNQQPDGTIEIPTPLIQYCGFSKIE
ncbi:MAG: serine--tRNA ligase [Patescibacteria group bacterium]|nr:serine--tRNA ligase [Patescibacteria group bacterium]